MALVMNEIKPFKIRDIEINPPLILSPMAGVTDVSFRRLLKRRGGIAAEGYDLCATARCQVYGGVAVEQPLSSRAVDETAGEVLTWNGGLIDALFTSTCGGRTESATDVFPNGSAPRRRSTSTSWR